MSMISKQQFDELVENTTRVPAGAHRTDNQARERGGGVKEEG